MRQTSPLYFLFWTSSSHRNGFHNYLDEFLSAIRIFGYLERPVFHELARHLQTRRLMAGDTLSLTEDKSFYIVIDGKVQVFVQPEGSTRGPSNAYEDEDDNGFRLINEVGSGATLSSLFTILNLFTEDVKLRYEPSEAPSLATSQRRSRASSVGRQPFTSMENISELNLGSPKSPAAADRPRSTSLAGAEARDAFRPTRLREATSFDSSSDAREQVQSPAEMTSELPESTSRARSPRPPIRPTSPFRGQSYQSESQERPASGESGEAKGEHIIARAVQDTTLAVLPAEAFRKLTKRYPNAAAHIVQGAPVVRILAQSFG